MIIRIGSRKSRLALWQTHHIADLLAAHHEGLEVEVVTMDTTGDKIGDVPLPKIGAKGLFTRELEDALLDDSIDLAVHSLKDLPSTLPEGLKYGGSPARAAATDSFISTRWSSIDELPLHGTIATGSQRRKAQLLGQRPGLQFTNLRGNIDTRIRKLDEHGWDGIIMATAALERLECTDLVTTELDPAIYVPAVSQGAIGIEIREGRTDVEALLAPILCAKTVQAVTAERIFMRSLDGGCSVALGAYCYERDGRWHFHGYVASPDGQQSLQDARTGDDPDALARAMSDDFIARGAREILRPDA